MKTICLLSIFLFSLGKMHAQDTLVSNTGMIIPAYIMESDSSYISYKGIDTTVNEISLIQRAKILLIKHRGGKVEQFYSNDTLLTMKGETVLTKVLEIDADLITCFYYNGTINEPSVIPTSSIFMIKLQDGSKELIDHGNKEAKGETKAESNVNYYAMGQNDGHKYFKTSGGAIAGEVVSGLATWIIFIGTIPGAGIAFTKPTQLHNSKNPNDKLLDSNQLYREGYMSVAKNKKMKDCGAAYASGAAIPIVLFVALFATYY